MRGLNSEYLVQSFYLKNGYQLVEKRWRSFYAEVDLVFFKKGQALALVEVKSGRFENSVELLSVSQAKRLHRLLGALSGILPTEVHLAVVSQEGSIQVFRDPLCDLLSF